MAEESFSLEFLWLPKVEDFVEINSILESATFGKDWRPLGPILKLKTNISKYCGFPVFVTDCKPRLEFDKSSKETKSKSENTLIYAEFLYNVICTIKLEKGLQQDYKRFIQLFCCCNGGKLESELWLKLHPSFISECSITTSNKFLELTKFSFGNFSELDTFVEHFNSKVTIKENGYKITQTKLQLLHDYKRILLYFVVGKIISVKKRNSSTHCLHKLEIPYAALHSIVISKAEVLTVYIRMFQPPLLYSVQGNDQCEDYISYLELYPDTPWFRTVDLFEGSPVYLRKEFSMNTVLKIEFVKAEEYDFLFQLLTHCKSIQIFFAPVVVRQHEQHTLRSIPIDNFDCFYAFQCLLTYSFEIMDQLIARDEFTVAKTFLIEKSRENSFAMTESLYIIFEAIIKGNILIFLHCLKVLYNRLQSTSKGMSNELSSKNGIIDRKQSHLLFIKRAIATPTHFRLLPPQPTLKSRALRDSDPSYSLRVSIKDVNLDSINYTLRQGNFSSLNPEDLLIGFYKNFVKIRLLQGIKIGNRNYKYIGSSTSQLKAHGMWFYAKDADNQTPDDLRRRFGELEKIKKVPKYMARMGQTFSQAMGNIEVPQSWTNLNDPEEDIKGGVKEYLKLDDEVSGGPPEKFLQEVVPKDSIVTEKSEPYVFSDGIGRISSMLAEEVYKELEVEGRPSAMQIRYAGCKGMLVVDPNLRGKQIVFRKSMKKFESNHDSLEILKFSEKRSVCLNRPFITILEQLKIPKEVFLELQKEMIQNHITSFFDESAACEFLDRNSLLRMDFLKMYTAGIHFTEDPLFRSMIFALFQKQIELLKKKASIEIPVHKGRTLFGVLDETRTLTYGQVFIQFSDWNTNVPEVLKGEVLVTKNPCMHPGDVRKFEAVDVEALHHIVDCLVFPAQGPRPHPDEMAGSDLDGDEYTAIWLKSLLFFGDNKEAMHFAIESNEDELERPVTPSDELDHFGNFIFNDSTGLIAIAHLIFADYITEGIFSKICIRLAKRYSISLDFAKSGKSVKQGRDRPHKSPDFMQKLDEKITYLSTKALGYLFRNCKILELGLETERNEIDYTLDPQLQHKDWDKKYKKSALRMLKQYSDKVKTLIKTYGFENEGQLLAGALINPPKYYENRHDMMNLMALLEYEVQYIFRELQQKFFSEFGGKPKDGKYTDDMHQKASAWYMVSYNKTENKGSSYFGLPWAVIDVLADLKTKQGSGTRIPNPKTLLEQVVDKSIAKHMPVELTPETDSLIIYENRFEVLDLALKVLTKWIKSQQDHFYNFKEREGYKKIERLFMTVFKEITDPLTTCDVSYIDNLKKGLHIKKAISPCYYIIQTILKLAKLGVQANNNSDIMQELGLLSWITLIKLSCTYNPQYLGIPNEAGQYAETVFYQAQDNIVDTIQLPLNEDKLPGNTEFTEKLLRDEPGVRAYLLNATKLKEIEFRCISRKKDTFVKLTVRGTRYCIEKLKDIAVMDNFYTSVINNTSVYGNN